MTNLRILSDLLISERLLNKTPAAMNEAEIQKLCNCVLAATPHVLASQMPPEAHDHIENVLKVFNTTLQEAAPCWNPKAKSVDGYGIYEKQALLNMVDANRRAAGKPALDIPEEWLKVLASEQVSFKGFIHLLSAWGMDGGKYELPAIS